MVEEKKDLEESSGLEIRRLMQENKRLIADLMMENRRLLQEQASLETQINILNAVSDGYKDDIGKLIHENEKLKTENKYLLKENKDLK